MITPKKLRNDMAKLDALMEAFEHTYLHFIDLGAEEMEQRNKGTLAFYALRDLLQEIINEMSELSNCMEICHTMLERDNIAGKENRK